ncbi:NAD(P)/FAD-dependent oxidoreductase [Massilia sp. CF038]|uniref:NAD(P)/FAD-dependent oxidoreductase n=1 Tax=Massilia sp. CF038 TaxID=1881045 RepID=UPI0009236954|nr:NAD(P)/FAD-dependent oxidoreductase [Massilia sp. CF038]SHG70639.1 Thioredoxin reductase [Massilia sp. CF038]
MMYDAIIVGGGPAGLSAALALGRARKHVLLLDGGPRRNMAALKVHNFVTRDGVAPDEFRRIGREQLAHYPKVEVRDAIVESISGVCGAFQVALAAGPVNARRILLCTGMVDEMLPIPGFAQLWGHAIYQCPYCHAWELQDRAWGYLVHPAHAHMLLTFALQARGWTSDLTVYTNNAFDLPAETSRVLEEAGIRLETAALTRVVGTGHQLESIELASGERVACVALFVHPPQHQTRLIQALGLALDDQGYVSFDPMKRETSVRGIYAAGDLTTRMQGAIHAAAAGAHAAAMLNAELTSEMILKRTV